MRVEYGPDRLSLTLTLESEEEAVYLWHLTNCGHGHSFTQYCEEMGYHDIPSMVKDGIWKAIDNVYNPREHTD